MKRVVRWLGFAIVTAAAATMLMADMVLARPATLAQTAMRQTTHQTAGQPTQQPTSQTARRTTMQQPASAFAIPGETGATTGYKDMSRGSR